MGRTYIKKFCNLNLGRGASMTMIELQKILGEEIEKVKSGTANIDNSKTIASLAKQMINNADVILRTDKYVENKGERINKVVGK